MIQLPHVPTLPNSPRTLHRWLVVRAIVASSMLVGCVEATAYEQATSAAAVQAEARRRLSEAHAQQERELEARTRECARLSAENARLTQLLSAREGAMDQAELELVVAKKEHSEEASLVRQLRGDLARVGSSLDVFADEKAALSAELDAARAENVRLEARVKELTAAPPLEAAPTDALVPSEEDMPAAPRPATDSEADGEADVD